MHSGPPSTAYSEQHHSTITRQMMIIAGGEPELCRRRHAKREGGVYAPRMHYVSVSLVQNAMCTCCAYVGKCEKGFV